MGFMNKLKSVNNSWGYVTYLSDGSLGRIFGRIGPKNMIDNRSQELMITSGTVNGPLKDEIVFAAKDVLRATVLQATSEWVKYRLELKNGLAAVVVMTVMDLPTGKAQGNKTTTNANFNNAWLNFEAWLGEALDRGYNTSACASSPENSKGEELTCIPTQKNEAPEAPILKEKDLSTKKEEIKTSPSKAKEEKKPTKRVEKPELGAFGITVGALKEKEHTQNTKNEDFIATVEDSAQNTDDLEEYMDARCPQCKEELSFIGFENGEQVTCPFCDFKFNLKK